MTTTTPDMNLILPDVSITAGPQWATLLNAAFNLIDSHDHSSGKGALITPAGLNISSDLTFAQNNATNLRTVRLFPNGSFSPVSTDKTCLYANGGELFYIDAAGNVVQITLNGSVDVSGSITALSLKDSSFFIQYFGDTTRQFRFDASAIPTATTRILSIPDSGGNTSFVTANATQTLTNKTLTTPVIAGINTGSVTFTLPTTDGTSGQVIQTNGSAALSFVSAATTVGNVAANDSNVTFIASNNHTQICTPTAARTYTMPTTGIAAGDTWTFVNISTTAANVITVQSSGGNTIDYVIPHGQLTLVALVNTPTTAAHWLVTAASSASISYTPTFSGLGTPTNVNVLARRERNFLHIHAFFAVGTTTAVAGSVSIPFGALISTSPVNAAFGGDGAIIGHYSCQDTNESGNVLTATATSQSLVYFGRAYSTTVALTSQQGATVFTSGNNTSFEARIPIANWG